MSSLGRSLARVAGLALLVSVLVGSSAQAQIGGFVKRAAKRAAADAAVDKATSAVGGKSGRLSPTVVGAEITADTLDMVLAGLVVAAARIEDVEKAYKRHQDLSNQLGDHRQKSYAAREKYSQQAEKTRDCYDESLTAINKAREPQLQARMLAVSTGANSKFAQEYAALAQQAAQALAKGDSVSAQRISDKMYKELFGIDFQADTAKARAKCGAFPAKPAIMVEEEALEKKVSDASDELRAAENASQDAGAKESRMPAERFALAKERLMTWYGLNKSGQADKQFGAKEHQLFTSRQSDIERVSKALR